MSRTRLAIDLAFISQIFLLNSATSSPCFSRVALGVTHSLGNRKDSGTPVVQSCLINVGTFSCNFTSQSQWVLLCWQHLSFHKHRPSDTLIYTDSKVGCICMLRELPQLPLKAWNPAPTCLYALNYTGFENSDFAFRNGPFGNPLSDLRSQNFCSTCKWKSRVRQLLCHVYVFQHISPFPGNARVAILKVLPGMISPEGTLSCYCTACNCGGTVKGRHAQLHPVPSGQF